MTTSEPRGNAFARTPFVQFLAGTAGRLVRIAAGVGLIVGGLFVIGGTAGAVVAAIGLVPIAAGVFDFCVLGLSGTASSWCFTMRRTGRPTRSRAPWTSAFRLPRRACVAEG